MLRKYQQDCLDSILSHYEAGVYQQLVVMATGTGKTVVFANLAAQIRRLLPGKMLVFAHREELVDQAVAVIAKWNPDLKVGKEMAEDYADTDCDTVVSCVASIGRQGSQRLQRFGEFDITICDEAHHSIASTYLNVFESTGVLKPESRKLLVGFTATPKRKNLTRSQKKQITTLDDENLLSLKSVYKKIVFTYNMRTAIKEGWLVPPVGFRLKTSTDLSGIKMVAGDFQQDQLAAAVNTNDRNLQIVKAWQDYAKGRQTVAFTVSIEHAKLLAQTFKEYGVPAEAVWGNDPDRAQKLENHRAKKFSVLTNCAVLTEGYDDWRIECIVLARPTNSSTLYTQMVGRGTRLEEGTGNLKDYCAQRDLHGTDGCLVKKDCYIIDVVDNYEKCSLVTLPSLVGLNPDFDLGGKDATKVAEQIEELQDKYPGVDFTKLTDLNNVKAYMEALDMFSAPYTEEVKEFSKFTWMATQDGSYVIAIPERRELKEQKRYAQFLHEKLHISLNELEEYELSITSTKDERKLGTFTTLQEAFTTADDVLRRCRADRIKLIEREAPWHKGAASDAAKRYLRKLTKKKPIAFCLCSGGGVAGTFCPSCKMPMGLTAGQAAIALNRLQVK